ncbi:MAG: hypothetical protein ABIP94_23130 [Planctomycetota bacterium]
MTPPSRRLWHRIAVWLAAAAVGALALWLSDLLQPPAAAPVPGGHGEAFQAMSVDPLSLHGAFPQRILWPLLAWAFGFGGPGAPLFTQVCNGTLLAVVCWFCRQHGARWLDAVLVTVAVALTGAVQVYKPLTCYSDTLNFIFLLLALHHVRRPAVFWSLVVLSAFSHEMVFFFAPWLVYERCRAGGLWWREGLAMVGVAFVYLGWSQVVKAWGSGQSYDAAYYFANNFLPWGTLGLWALLALMLLLEFGPLLAVIVWAWRTDRLQIGRWGPWLYTAGVLVMMVLAYDVMRFASFAFLPLVLGAVALLQQRAGRAVFAALMAAGIGSYMWLHRVPGEVGGQVFSHVTGTMLELGVLFDHTKFVTALLPRLWFGALVMAAAAAAVVAVGLCMARRFPKVADATHPQPVGSEPRTSWNASP